MSEPRVVLNARTDEMADWIDQCARGTLAFSGPDSLYARVRALGYNGNSLYEMVRARQWEIEHEPSP